jgi:hypothetical protein
VLIIVAIFARKKTAGKALTALIVIILVLVALRVLGLLGIHIL